MLILLDRDGVVNAESEAYVKCLAEFHPLPGSYEAVARLCEAGHEVAVVTNQSGIGRKLIDPEELDRIHGALRAGVARAGGRIARIEVCPHVPEDECRCRKPRTGLLVTAADALGFDPATSILVGDRASDLAAAAAFGCEGILVRTGRGRATAAELDGGASTLVVDDLGGAADAILARNARASVAPRRR